MTSNNDKIFVRRRRVAKLAGLAAAAAIAFGVGILLAGGSGDRDTAERYVQAWAAGDYEALYAELNEAAQGEFSLDELKAIDRDARRTATIRKIEIGESRGPISQDGEQLVPVQLTVSMRSFADLEGELGIPIEDGGVAWSPRLSFPGLQEGESLDRELRAPKRAPILDRDGNEIASGDVTERVRQGPAANLIGEIGAAVEPRAKQMQQAGFPEGTPAGNSGLELAFDEQLAGTPGGTLMAVNEDGRRVLAKGKPSPGRPLRTTIDPNLQTAAVDALGARFGGVAVVDTRKGDVLALAGIGLSAPQPPGSTFKIITAVAGLEAGVTDPSTQYPVVTSAPAGGREINNAHSEPCGGDLVTSFAKSCNTVFAPMGVELGSEKLVGAAERFGFNSPPPIYRESALELTQPPSSTLPNPVTSDVELAVTALGQGKVLATPLQMASVAQAIANDGVRLPTPLVRDKKLAGDFEPVEVTSPEIANQLRQMMVATVKTGTAKAAALPDVQVAGKTGTAELGPKPGQTIDPDNPDAELELEVDAWFTAFAPAKKPKLAIAVMVVNADGDGGVIAAPIARQVLAAGL